MLRQDVVQAVDEGRFSIYPVARIKEALTILLNKQYSGSAEAILETSREKAHAYYSSASKRTQASAESDWR
ncbi:MAG: putative ATP-dependent protease [Candidatus Azotimanducaceae bacterium]|jgi:predicted ATP-dependent protease